MVTIYSWARFQAVWIFVKQGLVHKHLFPLNSSEMHHILLEFAYEV